jgi:protein-arginine deiminase
MISTLLAHRDQAGNARSDVTLSTVVVLGKPWEIALYRSAPTGAKRVGVSFTQGVSLTTTEGSRVESGDTFEVSSDPIVVLDGHRASGAMNAETLTVTFSAGRETLERIVIRVAFVQLELLCDADRDGEVDAREVAPGWSWGRQGLGPILLVNNDRDVTRRGGPRRDRLDRRAGGPLDLQDMAPLVVAAEGPPELSARYRLVLQVSDAAAEKVRIFDVSAAVSRVLIEPGKPRASLSYVKGRRDLRMEGLQYPDVGFTGLITVDLLLTEDDEPISASRAVFRVAPWIMPSNVQRPRRVFMCEMREADSANQAALRVVENAARAANSEFVRVPPQQSRSDRWIQDEMEIGYSQAPGKTLGVVLDSPRNGDLDVYPERLIAPDFGWVTRGDDAAAANSLDSFGNLEVSPPVTVAGRSYPLGRIIFGGAHPTGTGRRMMKVMSDFLYAQQVQSPIELYSDWLAVGHVDEFMSFVPANDELGFRMLLASPNTAWQVLTDAQAEGHGGIPWLVGKKRYNGRRADTTVDGVLGDRELREANEKYQRYIDWNRGVLIEELGLTPEHILDLPVLYLPESGGAGAYFPDVVNLLVLGKTIVIPKPFGPEPSGTCILEEEIRRLMRPIGLDCLFVDTWYSYHILSGEIHCGTNAYRDPLETPWWETTPVTASDVGGARLARRRSGAQTKRKKVTRTRTPRG